MFQRISVATAALILLASCANESGPGAQGGDYWKITDRQPPLQHVLITLEPKSEERFLKNVERFQNAVVTIRARKMFSAEKSSGTGFFIDQGRYILTNEHVVRGTSVIEIRRRNGLVTSASVLAYHRARDVALLKTETAVSLNPEASDITPLPIRLDKTRLGEDVFVIGSPLGTTYASTLSRGMITGHRVRRGQNVIQSDADVLPGSSGSPLFDSFGNVVGIAVGAHFYRGGSTPLNFFIPIGEAIAALNGKIITDILVFARDSSEQPPQTNVTAAKPSTSTPTHNK